MVAFLITGALQLFPLWSKETGDNLVYVSDREGVAVVRGQELIALGSNGAIASRAKILSGQIPTCLSLNGLTTTPQYLKTTGSEGQHALSIAFGQYESVFRTNGGLLALTPKGIYSQGTFDLFSGVAVNRAGDVLVTMDMPMSAPIMRVRTLTSGQWVESQEPLTPEVEGAGMACIANGFNDLVFVNDRVLCFVGGIRSMKSSVPVTAEAAVQRGLASNVILPMEQSAHPARGYLFAINLRTRVTASILQLEMDGSGEMGSLNVGRLCPSFDGRYLYVRARDGIARLSVDQIGKVLE